jgi:hypothetical protein
MSLKKNQTLYLPNQNIAIDESLTLWKGCLSVRQYPPLKASKFGIKTSELCESTAGCLWRLLVYTGKYSSRIDFDYCRNPQNSSHSTETVRALVRSWTYTMDG